MRLEVVVCARCWRHNRDMADQAARAGRHEPWQLEGGAAELYQRHLVPAMTAHWAADLVRRVDVRGSDRVLDVACGTGVAARAAAGRAGPAGRVVGIDINAAMLAVARSLPGGQGARIAWFEASALALPVRDASHDVVLCQLGLQFFADRPAALAEIHRVLRPGGRLGVSVFGAIEHNPATFALSQALDRRIGPDASAAKRAEHALADPALLRTLVAGAGFGQITIVTQTRVVRFAAAGDYVRIQLAATPLAALRTPLARADAQRLTELLVADVAASLEPYQTARGLEFPQEAHVLLAVN
jgi:ubiquinone/menaquinone biosynthesis C-methylase UbiE